MRHVHKGILPKTARMRPPVFAERATASDIQKKPARGRPRAAAKHEDEMTQGERCRTITAAADFLAEQDDIDYESDEQDLLEAEAEVARLLGRV